LPSATLDPPLTGENTSKLSPLPPHILLLHLPALLIHPPSHPRYALSLCLSLLALRKCLAMKDDEKQMQGKVMDAEIECRAWTSLAEVGMRVVEAGFGGAPGGEEEPEGHAWAQGIEGEVCLTSSFCLRPLFRWVYANRCTVPLLRSKRRQERDSVSHKRY
jgi:hypothetical protein